jgi:D-3-phosphoglycerate dehydrogenase / 2-oxoglutarate reductase
MSRARIWLESTLHAEALARLEQAAEVVATADPARLAGCLAMIVGSRPRVDGDLLDQAGPELLAVARPGIGVDNVELDAATERGVLVINTPDGPTESTAEHATALLLALAKQVRDGDRWLRGPRTQPLPLGFELLGRTLGLVGLGRIGKRMAEICGRGLRMRVLAYDPYASPAAAEALGVELVDNLDALLARADVVSLHAPATAETRGLIGDEALRRMKPEAFLINVSRGSLVDEAALARALREGRLAGAGLDVFHVEPPPPDHPLIGLPNVIMTPHIGSATDGGRQKMSDSVVEQVLQVLRGERPSSLVNPEAWPGRTAAR